METKLQMLEILIGGDNQAYLPVENHSFFE
jgi:hypothetical protein